MAKTLKNSKKIKKSKKKSEISSENQSYLSLSDNNEIDNEDFENIDEKRIRMAKEIIGEYKNNLKDEFFEEEEENENIINKLQDKILKDKLLDKKSQTEDLIEIINKKEYSEVILKGHKKPITMCKLFENKLISISKDSSIIIWDLENNNNKFILSYGNPKDINGHKDELLCMDISYDGKYLITSGKDTIIKAWDLVENKFLGNMKGHKSTVNSLKFKFNSYQFCSISDDRSLKIWDVTQLCFMEQFFGHRSKILDLDSMTEDNMVTIGEDKQCYIWKLDKSTQLVYKERKFWLDSLTAINRQHFLTGSQDGEIALWITGKLKPVFTQKNVHQNNWITALGSIYNGDTFFSGANDNKLNIYKLLENENKFIKRGSLEVEGIINSIEVDRNLKYIAVVESCEMRLGRWITKNKIKSKIRVFKF